MKILHTADWHIGQLFHEYDRTYEHQEFLDWLINTIQTEKIDVVLISGDVFDVSNPHAAAIRMFYTFLNQATKVNPYLQIIVTAGNHDSAARLEAPQPLLESSNIYILGTVERDNNGNIRYDKLTIPIKNKEGMIVAWCLAVPFLRIIDCPLVEDAKNKYVEGVAAFYKCAFEALIGKKEQGQAIIAMGHLHAQKAEVSDLDRWERGIMGGVERISSAVFHEDIRYVALGHIHKAQQVDDKDHIRYSGSPLPMSFTEVNYRHQVITFQLDGDGITEISSLEVPLAIPLIRIPITHCRLPEVLGAIEKLPVARKHAELAPYLEVRVLTDGPSPELRHKIEKALSGKHARLARINVQYENTGHSKEKPVIVEQPKLDQLQPLEVFSSIYKSKYNRPVPEKLITLFSKVIEEINQKQLD